MDMRKMSKYEALIGSVVNEVLVSNYRRVEKVSKTTGKRYYKYEVELENVLWVSTQSFNKGSFRKRLAKLMASKTQAQPKEQPKYELIPWQPVVRGFLGNFSNDCLNIITKEFEQCSTMQDARTVLRKYAKYCHPDKGFNTLIDNFNWEFVLCTYECVVKLLDVLQSAWDDDDDFSWDDEEQEQQEQPKQEPKQPKYELILWQPIVRDGFKRFSNYCLGIINKEFGECGTIKEARAVFRKYANYCHPDKGYNSYIDNKNWNFVLHTYECVVKYIDILQDVWDADDDFSWEAC